MSKKKKQVEIFNGGECGVEEVKRTCCEYYVKYIYTCN